MFKQTMKDGRIKEALQETVKVLSHGAIFLATCNAILLVRDVNL